MLNLKNYTGSELQNFLSMLNQCETEGIAEIRFVREKIHNYIHGDLLENRIKAVKTKRELKIPKGRRNLKSLTPKFEKYKLCPACGKARLYPVHTNTEGLEVVGCSKCRYSEIVEEK